MTTYYVSTAGNNGNSGTSTGAAWRTIQYAISQVSAGDTIKVLPGTYNENLLISDSNSAPQGTSGSPITITSNDTSNMAVITGTEQVNQVRIFNRSYWTIDHIAFKNYNTGGIHARALSADVVGITVQYCLFENQNAQYGGMWHALVFDGSEPYALSYSYALYNTFRNIVTGPSGGYNETLTMHLSVHHCLVEGNEIYGTTYIGLNSVSGSNQYGGLGKPHHIIMRNNRVDYVQSAPSGARTGMYIDGADYVLIENNYITRADGIAVSSECWNSKRDWYEFRNNIVRNNVFDGTGGNSSVSLGMGVYSYLIYLPDDPYAAQRWIVDGVAVHNVCLMNNVSGGAYKWVFGKRTMLKNNVIANYAAGSLITYMVSGLTIDQWETDGNLYWRPSNPTFSWPPNHNPASLAALQQVSGQESNSIYGQPVFVQSTRTALEHYKLGSTSPGYGAGVALTTATNSGSSSTTLTVGNAAYFCDGYGLIGGDTIFVGGTEATVSAVNYDTDTITLSSAISWSVGAAVGYAANPSIGLLDDVSGEWTQTLTANAGADQTIYDDNGDGLVSVTLSAALSYSPATITSYQWTSGTTVLSTAESFTTTFGLGTHGITLSITDSEANTDTDTVVITVLDPGDIVSSTVVRNPCLNGFSNWLTWSSGVTTWESAPSGTGVEITVTSDGGNTQLSQSGLTVQTGQLLTLRVVGEAIGSQTSFPVQLFLNTAPYTLFGLNETVTLETSETVVEIPFYVTANSSDARLYAGLSTGDNIIIREFNLLGPDDTGCYDETYTPPDPPTEDGSVSLDSTDTYFVDAGGQFYTNQNPSSVGDWRSLYSNYDFWTGWIFTLGAAESIPENATITSATLTVTSAGYDTTDSGTIVKMRISVEDAADPAKPTTYGDATGRSFLPADDPWEPVAWVALTEYESADFADAIQDLVDSQGGLAAEANIHLKLGDKEAGWNSVKRYGYVTNAAATLDIAWTVPSTGTFAEEINPLRPGVGVGLRQGF